LQLSGAGLRLRELPRGIGRGGVRTWSWPGGHAGVRETAVGLLHPRDNATGVEVGGRSRVAGHGTNQIHLVAQLNALGTVGRQSLESILQCTRTRLGLGQLQRRIGRMRVRRTRRRRVARTR
jgi:hypothetical protein